MSVIAETKEANQLGRMVEIQMELMTAGDLELESEGGMPGNEAESCNSNAMQVGRVYSLVDKNNYLRKKERFEFNLIHEKINVRMNLLFESK
jgi:hypothetical protein